MDSTLVLLMTIAAPLACAGVIAQRSVFGIGAVGLAATYAGAFGFVYAPAIYQVASVVAIMGGLVVMSIAAAVSMLTRQ